MNECNDAAETRLRLAHVVHPTRRGVTVQLFANWLTACAHLRDHLLCAPECEAWALVIPDYDAVVDPADGGARYGYAEESRKTHGASAQRLYDLCAEAVSADAIDAQMLNWAKNDGPVTAAMGTDGIVMLIEDVVRSAFLAGQGDPQKTKDSQRQRLERRGLPRESPMRSGGSASQKKEPTERELRRRRKREAKWSHEERLFHRVFRPTVQFVKRSHHRARDMLGRLVRADYALLKDVLPLRSQLKFEHWLELRRQCRRKE